MRRDHLTKEQRPVHFDITAFPEEWRVRIHKYRAWYFEVFRRYPTESEVRRWLRSLS